jgi:hypothetical protein
MPLGSSPGICRARSNLCASWFAAMMCNRAAGLSAVIDAHAAKPTDVLRHAVQHGQQGDEGVRSAACQHTTDHGSGYGDQRAGSPAGQRLCALQ